MSEFSQTPLPLREYCLTEMTSLRLLTLERRGSVFFQQPPTTQETGGVIDQWREFHFSQVRYAAKRGCRRFD